MTALQSRQEHRDFDHQRAAHSWLAQIPMVHCIVNGTGNHFADRFLAAVLQGPPSSSVHDLRGQRTHRGSYVCASLHLCAQHWRMRTGIFW